MDKWTWCPWCGVREWFKWLEGNKYKCSHCKNEMELKQMFDKLIYKLTSPKFCKRCGGELVTDVQKVYSAKTGLAIAQYVGIRCKFWYTCFEKHGYLYRWYEHIRS